MASAHVGRGGDPKTHRVFALWSQPEAQSDEEDLLSRMNPSPSLLGDASTLASERLERIEERTASRKWAWVCACSELARG
jgi:hypothetical protein